MNKKLLTVIGGSVMSAMLFSGCGVANDPPPPAEDGRGTEINQLNRNDRDNRIFNRTNRPGINDGMFNNRGTDGGTIFNNRGANDGRIFNNRGTDMDMYNRNDRTIFDTRDGNIFNNDRTDRGGIFNTDPMDDTRDMTRNRTTRGR
ncbi:hypothetical protein [Bacillus sp. B15-48]|uniref:hypothetical protein n=1 Tax=Bacillus sp. B15-48 TaxID=1548601 RepID=UPI00193F8989|nr:hypothetical protein [Bacillus sp. B15-48]MBM4761504.1 hypothetical protein [Bacillus sp. B15-48]